MKIYLPIVYIFAVLFLTGCNEVRSTLGFCPSIAEIKNAPHEYSGKEICVKGVVTQSVNAVVIKYYVLEDESGSITVVTDGIPPEKGKVITAKGMVEEFFRIPGLGQSLVIRETPPSDAGK